MNSNFYINKNIFKQNINNHVIKLNQMFICKQNLIKLINKLIIITYYDKNKNNFKLNTIIGKLIKINNSRLSIWTKDNIIIKLPLNSPLLKTIKIFNKY
uniref:50S ribosomal protein L19 n=1 Tax=Nephromyces sp. ex Molgula occidentalis TaxID=2544991 RepID=A0A5C1H846_9APIC|nr:hypothetical protein [Nephromyces sp. ex Molgula occidentalis]